MYLNNQSQFSFYTLKKTLKRLSIQWCFVLLGILGSSQGYSQATHSVARQWNDLLLESIRLDFARPTVHARNLFHTSVAMYDIWALFDDTSDTFFLDRRIGDVRCALSSDDESYLRGLSDTDSVIEEGISYAMYRLILHRFQNAPGFSGIRARADILMNDLGFDTNVITPVIRAGDGAALGNKVAGCIINFGFQDGSNEQNDYTNTFYEPVNTTALDPSMPGNPGLLNPNRWQSLDLGITIDQSGNEIDGAVIFLSPEWGNVVPFALTEEDRSVFTRDGNVYQVYHDPGDPALLTGPGAMPAEYVWNTEIVSLWSSHLDPSDGVMWDISPASIGNTDTLPTTLAGLRNFYDRLDGGVSESGHTENPATGLPYAPQMVPRGDYTRVLAEFWADGPDSETPPGHWYVILNELVTDHPDFVPRYRGQGDILDDLEWDVKAYFALGGALHDAAVSAWSIKGWYDYIRPVSAIRHLQALGQSSDQNDPDCAYDPNGLTLEPGFIECVRAGDALAGTQNENVGKIKVFAWRGPDFISDPFTDVAGVGWILAENWWPYQRPTFVTPPFAGYVSGHSTFSRAAAELLTLLTGDAFFPGGMGEFTAAQNDFLVFERGPSVDITLQWATYRDASDQTSLSRIWGGIHPPVDDVPGRLIGLEVGIDAFNLADRFITGNAPSNKLGDSRSSGFISTAMLFGLLLLGAFAHFRKRWLK